MTEATTTTEAATETKVELTLDQKIEALETRLAKLRQQKLTESLLSNIEKGDKVTIKFGRADKVRHIEGEVVGVALPNVAVLAGDLETYKVNVRDIIANPTAADRTGPVHNPEEIDPVTGRRPGEAGAPSEDELDIQRLEGEGGVAGSDPLENA